MAEQQQQRASRQPQPGSEAVSVADHAAGRVSYGAAPPLCTHEQQKQLSAAAASGASRVDASRTVVASVTRAAADAAASLEHSRHLLRVSQLQRQQRRHYEEGGASKRVPLATPSTPEEDGRFGQGFIPTTLDLRSDVVRISVPRSHCRTFMAFGGRPPP